MNAVPVTHTCEVPICDAGPNGGPWELVTEVEECPDPGCPPEVFGAWFHTMVRLAHTTAQAWGAHQQTHFMAPGNTGPGPLVIPTNLLDDDGLPVVAFAPGLAAVVLLREEGGYQIVAATSVAPGKVVEALRYAADQLDTA